jgi:hypothetical protein
MSTDQHAPLDPVGERHLEEEIRGLLLRLLRLVAAEVE